MTKYILIAITLLGTTSTARADLDMWLTEVGTNTPTTFVGTNYSTPTVVNVGGLDAERTYEFIVNASANASSALMADRVGNGWGIKFEQWNNTQRYGITHFGVADYTSNVETTFDQDVHVTFVVRDYNAGSPFPGFEDYRTEIYVNGELKEAMNVELGRLSGVTAVAGGLNADDSFFDVLPGTVKGVATYNVALAASEIMAHSDAYFTPVPEPSSMLGLVGLLATGAVIGRVRRRGVSKQSGASK